MLNSCPRWCHTSHPIMHPELFVAPPAGGRCSYHTDWWLSLVDSCDILVFFELIFAFQLILHYAFYQSHCEIQHCARATSAYCHKHNHPMGPVGRVPSTLQDVGTKTIWSRPTFVTKCLFFLLFPEQVIDIGYCKACKTHCWHSNMACRCYVSGHGLIYTSM